MPVVTNIRVFCRFRPETPLEKEKGSSSLSFLYFFCLSISRVVACTCNRWKTCSFLSGSFFLSQSWWPERLQNSKNEACSLILCVPSAQLCSLSLLSVSSNSFCSWCNCRTPNIQLWSCFPARILTRRGLQWSWSSRCLPNPWRI